MGYHKMTSISGHNLPKLHCNRALVCSALTYISLLVIFCIIMYVTNKKILNLDYGLMK